MQLQTLVWRYVGLEDCIWEGSTKGLLRYVVFQICRTEIENVYLVRTDFVKIRAHICTGAFAAKQKAQDLLNSYALSLIIL